MRDAIGRRTVATSAHQPKGTRVMSSRRSLRQVLVAVLLGVLVGGGLMAVTPAGAEVSSAVATNWKKIWKKNLKPLADKRYHTKKQSNARYQPKGSYETAGSGYTKAESDAKYAPYPKTLRGTYLVSGHVPAAGDYAFGTIAYGATLTAPPTTVFVPAAGPANPNCTGSAAAPAAAPGHLCVYEGAGTNSTGFLFASATGTPGVSSPYGVNVRITSVGAGLTASLGGWALTPAGGISPKVTAPGAGRGSGAFLGR
jgi:hypothetical protein